MKITKVETALIQLPLERPLRTAIHQISAMTCLLVTLRTDEGIFGEGYSFGFSEAGLRATDEMTKGLADFVIGKDPRTPDTLFDEMLQGSNFFGQAGIIIHAMTTIDVACWDIVGKAAGLPLYRVFGGERERIPAYASGGLWLSSSIDELQAEAKGFLAQGFKAMKMRLGSPKVADDADRAAAIREVIGPDIALMADANQGLTVPHAIRLGHALEGVELTWFEEPVPTWDHEGHAQITAALKTPVASGETEYLRFGLENMLQRKAANILMPDLQRMGGYTEFRRVIGIMAAQNIPFSPHIFTEHSLHLCSLPGALYAEHMPWFGPLFKERMILDTEGMIAMPQGPGIGFTFDWDGLDSHRLSQKIIVAEKNTALVLGARSLVGSYLIDRLLAADYRVICVSRDPDISSLAHSRRVEWIAHDVTGDAALTVPSECIVFSLLPLWLFPPFLPRLIGGRQIIAFGSTSALTKTASGDKADRDLANGLLMAELALAEVADVPWTILRPTMIYGGGQDSNISVIAGLMRRFGVFPLAGAAKGLRQPVHADDLSSAAIAAVANEKAFGKTFNLPGGETLSYRNMVLRIAERLERKVLIFRAPVSLLSGAVKVAKIFNLINQSSAMVTRINQDLIFDDAAARQILRYQPRLFDPEI